MDSTAAQNLDASLRVTDISWISRAFRFISIANYFMLVYCGQSAIAAVAGLFSARTGVEIAFLAIMLGVNAFSAWVAWSNIGELGAVVHGYTKPAMFIQVMLAIVVLLAVWPSVEIELGEGPRGGPPPDIFNFGCTELCIALAATGGFSILTFLSRVRLHTLGISLGTLLHQDLEAQNRAKAHRLPPSSPGRGILWGLLGVGLLLIINAEPPGAYQPSQLLPPYCVAFMLLTRARHNFQPTFEDLMAGDERPPVLYLRSFSDDPKWSWRRTQAIPEKAFFDFSLESRLAAHFVGTGPFIALAAPGDKDPHMGAVRVGMPDDEWQESVIGWMAQASIILVMAGTSRWAAWEVSKVFELAYSSKLIVVFPESLKHNRERLAILRQALSGSPWEVGLTQATELIPPKQLRSIVFRAAGKVDCVTSRVLSRTSFHLGTVISHYVQMQDRKESATAGLGAQPRSWLRRGAWPMAQIGALALVVYLISHNAERWSNSLGTLEPLPASTEVTTNGKLRVGDFKFIARRDGPVRTSSFRPGETVTSSYAVEGFELGANGCPDVEIEYSLIDSVGARASPITTAKFDGQMREGQRMKAWVSLPLRPLAPVGDYYVEVKVYDRVAKTELTFNPRFQVK